MKRKNIDFTEGDIVKKLLAFSWPLILVLLLQNLYNMADTVILGRFVGYATVLATVVSALHGTVLYRMGKWKDKRIVKEA